MPEDIILRVVVYIAFGLLVATLLIMLQVLLLSEIARRTRRRRTHFNEIWRPYFAMRGLSEEPALPPFPQRNQRLWFLLLWNRIQYQLRGTARERLNTLLIELDMEKQVLWMLRSRSVRRRLIALTCMRYLARPEHWQAVMPLLAARNTTVSIVAAQTLVAIDAAKAMAVILPLSVRRVDWAFPRVAGLCQQAGTAAVTEPLLTTLAEAPEEAKPRLVRLLVWADPRKSSLWARDVLDGDSDVEPEDMQTALACVGTLSDPRDHPRLLVALEHDSEIIRLAALRALRRQVQPSDSAILQHLLTDRSWWIRQEAADALVDLPSVSREVLEQLSLEIDDRYGRDALLRALTETRS